MRRKHDRFNVLQKILIRACLKFWISIGGQDVLVPARFFRMIIFPCERYPGGHHRLQGDLPNFEFSDP
jgi:hypothetical protein